MWQIPLVLRVISSYVVSPILIKMITGLPSLTRRFVWQYFFATLISGVALLYFRDSFHSIGFLVATGLGVFNAIAAYCQWKATAISLSKTSLFTQADDVIALVLGYVFLQEAQFLNYMLCAGLVLCATSIVMFIKRKKEEQPPQPRTGISRWILISSTIWGIEMFFMRLLSLNNIPMLTYVAGRYCGSFLSAWCIFRLSKEPGPPLTWQQATKVAPLAIVIWVGMMFQYWTYSLAPLTVAQPIFQVAEMVLPTISGLWLFREIKGLDWRGQLAILIGLAGGITVALSY